MLSQLTLISFIAAAGLVRSDVVPTKPGPNEVYKVGSDCSIAWNLDPTGTWTSFSVDLMSGSNLAMQPVVNVFRGKDGTQGPTTFTFPCPDVTPNSAIYFYQFSKGENTSPAWTTRFTIASSTGAVKPPANPTQPGGQAIPWGVGHLSSAASTTGSSSATNVTAATAPPPNANLTALNTPAIESNTTGVTNSSTTAPSKPVDTPATPSPTPLSAAPAINRGSGSTPSPKPATQPASTASTPPTSAGYRFGASGLVALAGSFLAVNMVV